MISKSQITELRDIWQTPESNVAREFVQHVLLSAIFQLKGADSKLAFKGGTELRLLRRSPRFSEDLDFTAWVKPFHVGEWIKQAAKEAGRVGLDFKMGLGSNLTLEATVNPDFGQVEADPAEVNLSAFETFFTERRPFFVEGSQLLSGPVNNYFYSRRIGAPPSGRVSADFVDYPPTTTILGAAKVIGRLASKTSVGVLGALTGEESARTYSAGVQQFGRARVASLMLQKR